MSNIPNASGYGPRGNTPFVIINGMRVPVGNGMRGSDLASAAGPGRRAIKISGGKAQYLDSNRFYGAEDLIDRSGRPVKISSIPDRTKGAGLESLQLASAERVLVFLDYANIQAARPACSYLDYGSLLEYLGSWRFLVDAYAYVPIDPRMPDARRQLVRNLQRGGWMVYQKMGKIAGDSYKSNVDVEMCIDILRSAQQIRPDIITICSGDGDFLPLVRELRRMGIRAEVASFEASADRSLQYEASGFISLDVWYEETAYDLPDQAENANDEAVGVTPSVGEGGEWGFMGGECPHTTCRGDSSDAPQPSGSFPAGLEEAAASLSEVVCP